MLTGEECGVIRVAIMNDGVSGPLTTAQLLGRSWQLFRGHLRIFVPLMGLPIAALVLGSAVLFFMLFPEPEGVPLREVFDGMSTLSKTAVSLLFLGNLAVIYHVLGASMWAAGEFLAGREVRLWQAICHFGGKHARLFWVLNLISLFGRGPGVVLPLIAGFGFAPAFPVAKLENLGVIKAIRRGDALSKGKHGRIALLYALFLVLAVAGVVGLIAGLVVLRDSFGKAWFLRPVFPLGMWVILLVPQFYMVALTVNYFDMRSRSEATTNP